MIKIVQAVFQAGLGIKLRFSDGSFGVMDFSEMLSHKTSLTRALEDDVFFQRFFIELGALCWPNGLEFSAGSLYKRLEESGKLVKPAA
ncbi:DUF2442 domain-containing protein [Endozoicomonas sp. GU-1]|uniref:DUF2442 domain-containing protein n=1 Tax=Endozoicomonas sp. GU-1 TaxID=3009078 RepID=UPI0022B40B90|nr:DUF2442 domain-containing protein [Endozoicomonas sp. GU-1]WBA82905.1 DUF2442 domain-containing protein [Endozoicomonas sp. GU-1]WBA85832.1 DUF2442 domain-containing protein [Endozoicomonas sp. GU-1]